MRIEAIKRSHERVVGIEPEVLTVLEDREPVSLVALEAVIAAQGQIKPEQQEKHSGASEHGSGHATAGSDPSKEDENGVCRPRPTWSTSSSVQGVGSDRGKWSRIAWTVCAMFGIDASGVEVGFIGRDR